MNQNSIRKQVLAALPDATLLARAPGRVNLIGEHTDYNGFAVLPMAIDRGISIAAAPRERAAVIVRSIEPARYPSEQIELEQIQQRPRRGSWCDYVVAALRCYPPTSGLELVVGGDVPADAGLSSSAALVVAALLALTNPVDRKALAERARLAEQYVGTLSGGMDQAISLLGREGHALRIDFRPLRVRPVPLPPALAVLVAHSGISSAKGGAAQKGYNARVAEAHRAAHLLGAPSGGLLADVPGEDRLQRARALADPLLRRRASFVFAEAERVDRAEEALARGDLQELGRLLDASHAGLRDEYEVSHPAVDELVEELRAAGALGARIVGAGFGGCAVAICPREQSAAIQARLSRPVEVFTAAGPARREELLRP